MYMCVYACACVCDWVCMCMHTGADPGFFEVGDLGAAEAHLRAPFMHAAHKGCEPSGTGGLGGIVSPPLQWGPGAEPRKDFAK